jgi:hypothetical protein
MTTLWIPMEVAVWIGTFLVASLSGFWLVWDALRLRRYLPRGRAAHDEIFGSVVGIVTAIIGLIGVLRYHLGG